MTETVALSPKEQLRLEVLGGVKGGHMDLAKAAELLKVSYRQMLRIKARFDKKGGAGLAHRLRGRPSNRRADPEHKAQVVELYRKQYGDFGPTLAAQVLWERDKLQVNHETLRGWLLENALWKKCRRRQKHRSRREPRAHRGEMLQLDGSPHDWLEGRGPRCVLIEGVDDATGAAYGRFYPEETSVAVMDLLLGYIRRHGIPRSLYVDKDSIYVVNNREPTAREILTGTQPLTQVGRAMKELQVELIPADSPQAKGRVERVHGTHQDRLTRLMRLEGINTLEGANAYLEAHYWQDYNQRFARLPKKAADLHRKPGRGMVLEEILCHKEPRTVGRDWCVTYGKRVFQLAPKHQNLALAGREILVLEKLDGTLLLRHQRRDLDHWRCPPRTPAAGLGASPAPGPASAPPPPAPAPPNPPAPRTRHPVTLLSG